MDWLARVWRTVHPMVDVTAHGDHMKWAGLRQASNITRKLAVLSLLYGRIGINMLLQVPAAQNMEKVILGGTTCLEDAICAGYGSGQEGRGHTKHI